MRTRELVILLSLGAIATVPLGYADEKKDRAAIEKELAELDAGMVNHEWSVKNKKAIEGLTKALADVEQVELFRLDPNGTDDDKNAFHGYEIRVQHRIESKDQRKEVLTFVGQTLHWNEFRKALCFHPRHGMRAVIGKKTLDFLICFECNRILVYENAKRIAALALGETDKNHPLEQVLAALDKKAKDGK